MLQLLRSALGRPERGLGHVKIQADDEALRHLAKVADGDARKALNSLEIAALTTSPGRRRRHSYRSFRRRTMHPEEGVVYDADGDAHYDTISAFIKSMRGSDPGCGAVLAGEDDSRGRRPALHHAANRDLRGGRRRAGRSDGVGAGAGGASTRRNSSAGRRRAFPSREATIYIATANKSNSAIVAIDAALEDVRSGRTLAGAGAFARRPLCRARSDWATAKAINTRTIFRGILWRRIISARPGDITSRANRARKRRSRSGWKNGVNKLRRCEINLRASRQNERRSDSRQSRVALAFARHSEEPIGSRVKERLG